MQMTGRFARNCRPVNLFEWELAMVTKVSTPQMVFMQPQRLIVPLFQRPYATP